MDMEPVLHLRRMRKTSAYAPLIRLLRDTLHIRAENRHLLIPGIDANGEFVRKCGFEQPYLAAQGITVVPGYFFKEIIGRPRYYRGPMRVQKRRMIPV